MVLTLMKFKLSLTTQGWSLSSRSFCLMPIKDFPKTSTTGNLKFLTHVYLRLFVIINGNCIRKDLDFENIVLTNFNDGIYIGDLIDLVSNKKLSMLNAKEIAFRIIDGDQSSPESLMKLMRLEESGD